MNTPVIETAKPEGTSDLKGIDFSLALKLLKNGKHVARAGWNGKGMWLVLHYGLNRYVHFAPGGVPMQKGLEVSPWVGMKTADDKFVPWLCSQTDMLAEDWELVV